MELAHLHLETDNPEKFSKKMKGFVASFRNRPNEIAMLDRSAQMSIQALNLRPEEIKMDAKSDKGKQSMSPTKRSYSKMSDVSPIKHKTPNQKLSPENREKLREEVIERINHLRTQKIENIKKEEKSYSLAQLKSISDAKGLLAENDLKNVLGITNENHYDEPVMANKSDLRNY